MRAWKRRDLLTYLSRVLPVLGTLDHFELLDIDVKSDDAAIQAAFHSMAAGLHPDRHRNILNGEQHTQLVRVYAHIAEAYRVLRNAEHREKYLRDMARKKRADTGSDAQRPVAEPTAETTLLSPKAQQLYRRSVTAMQLGDKGSAVLYLRMAVAKHPKSAFLKDALRELTGK